MSFSRRSVMTKAFIWHQKVKFANLQLPNVMLKDHEQWIVFSFLQQVQSFDNSSGSQCYDIVTSDLSYHSK